MKKQASVSMSMKNGVSDEHLQAQRAVIDMVMPLIKESVVSIPRPLSAYPFTIVDYGCGEGYNSRRVMAAAIEAVRGKRSDQHFMVVHNDLPANNFNRLLDSLYDGGSELYATEYGASDATPVFVMASGQSFYTQLMPASTVHFGLSSCSLHWTTNHPKLKSHIYHSGASEQESKEYAAIAASDWREFLESRVVELVKGGRLVVTMAARFESKRAHVPSEGAVSGDLYSCQSMMDLLNAVLCDLESEGLVDRHNLESFVVPIYCRSEAEIVAPVASGFLKDKLQAEHCWISAVRCPYHTQYILDGDAPGYARRLTAAIRAFTEPVLLRQLFGVKERRRKERNHVAEQHIVNSIYDRIHRAVQSAPDRFTFYPVQAFAVFRKII